MRKISSSLGLKKKYSSLKEDENKPDMRRSLSQFSIKKKPTFKEQKTPSSAYNPRSKKTIPEQIQTYLSKRSDVEIIKYFDEYYHQFEIKAKVLHDYIYNSPEPEKIKMKYLNMNDPHYRNGLECVMLKLYRNGTIVPESYNNLRESAVEQIQDWVLSWIHRKIMYGKLEQDENNQLIVMDDVLNEIKEYEMKTIQENTSF